MKYAFTCRGHEHLKGTHRNTIEFTKDTHLTPRGDCIIGIAADYDIRRVREFLTKKRIRISLQAGGHEFHFTCLPNLAYTSDHEMVCRRGEFNSDRTLGLRADKAAMDIPRPLIKHLTDPESTLHITIENETEDTQEI